MTLREQAKYITNSEILNQTEKLAEIIVLLIDEVDSLHNELELVRTRCDRNRDTSSGWMD